MSKEDVLISAPNLVVDKFMKIDTDLLQLCDRVKVFEVEEVLMRLKSVEDKLNDPRILAVTDIAKSVDQNQVDQRKSQK